MWVWLDSGACAYAHYNNVLACCSDAWHTCGRPDDTPLVPCGWGGADGHETKQSTPRVDSAPGSPRGKVQLNTTPVWDRYHQGLGQRGYGCICLALARSNLFQRYCHSPYSDLSQCSVMDPMSRLSHS